MLLIMVLFEVHQAGLTCLTWVVTLMVVGIWQELGRRKKPRKKAESARNKIEIGLASHGIRELHLLDQARMLLVCNEILRFPT